MVPPLPVSTHTSTSTTITRICRPSLILTRATTAPAPTAPTPQLATALLSKFSTIASRNFTIGLTARAPLVTDRARSHSLAIGLSLASSTTPSRIKPKRWTRTLPAYQISRRTRWSQPHRKTRPLPLQSVMTTSSLALLHMLNYTLWMLRLRPHLPRPWSRPKLLHLKPPWRRRTLTAPPSPHRHLLSHPLHVLLRLSKSSL